MIKIDHINVIRLVDKQQKTVRVTEFRTTLNSQEELEEYRVALRKIYELVYHTPVDIHFRYTIAYDGAEPQNSGDNQESGSETQPAGA